MSACSRHNIPAGIGMPYVLTGTIQNMDSGKLYLVQRDRTGENFFSIFDSTVVVHGGFLKSGRLLKPLGIKLQKAGESTGWPYTSWFILDSGHTNAILFSDSMPSSIVNGSELQRQLNEYNKREKDTGLYYSTLMRACLDKSCKDSVLSEREQASDNIIAEQVNRYPGSFVSTMIARNTSDLSLSFGVSDSVDSKRAQRDEYYNQQLFAWNGKIVDVTSGHFTANGETAPPFTVRDLQGHRWTNKSFRGEYVLLNFWASWNKPSLAEYRNLKKMYEKYKRKGVRVLSVSLDYNNDYLQEALKQLAPSWPQVCDFKVFETPLYKKFHVNVIPYNFFIGPDGKIIDQNIIGDRLQQVLQQ